MTPATPARRRALDTVTRLSQRQREAAYVLRVAVLEARREGASWRELGEATGIGYASVLRQVKAGSPVVVIRPYQQPGSRWAPPR